MEQTNSIKHWGLLLTRGFIYLLTGAYIVLAINAVTPGLALLLGGVFIGAGVLGSIYGFYTLRANRNYFWELLRSVFDIGFGITFLIFAPNPPSQFVEALSFWAVMYGSIHTVQAMYIAMLSGGKQPRNLAGTLLHLLGVVTSGGLAFVLLNPDAENVSWPVAGLLLALLGLIIILLAVQQRRAYFINRTA